MQTLNYNEELADSNWSGRVLLWQEQALFLGQAAETSLHTSPAIKICIALDGEFNLRTSSNSAWKSFQSAIITPGQIHAIDGKKNKLAMLVLVPEAAAAQLLAPLFLKQGLSVMPPLVIKNLLTLFEDFPEASSATVRTENICQKILEIISDGKQFSLSNSLSSAIDPRVSRSIELLRDEHAQGVSVGEIAANVALSESRFSHLFSEQVGVPVRRYLLWLRLRNALHLLAGNVSLTETAHAAGFADSAHLARTFRAMLGIAPSALIKHSSLISFAK